jgi:hypothetical protein
MSTQRIFDRWIEQAESRHDLALADQLRAVSFETPLFLARVAAVSRCLATCFIGAGKPVETCRLRITGNCACRNVTRAVESVVDAPGTLQ